MSWISHDSTKQCVGCHIVGLVEPERDSGEADLLRAFSSRSEMNIWLKHDKHSIARRRVEPFLHGADFTDPESFDVANKSRLSKVNSAHQQQVDRAANEYPRLKGLRISMDSTVADWWADSNRLSTEICRKLGYRYEDFQNNCLTCHGGYHKKNDSEEKNDEDLRFAEDLNEHSQIGIDCLHCHQSDQNKNIAWILKHQDASKWRPLPPDAKEAEGMNDLVPAKQQAAICMACHVGNEDQFVTHEMYVAGHPILPPFELEHFCNNMPKHWKTPGDLYESLEQTPAIRDAYFKVNYRIDTTTLKPSGVFWQTRKMLIGALLARKQTLELYQSKHMPDLALYDCAACHHELKGPSSRQQRILTGAPGRPRQSEWQMVLLGSAYQPTSQLRALSSVHQLEKSIAASFSVRPFGDTQQIKALSGELTAALQQYVEMLEQTPLAAKDAKSILATLLATPDEKLLTYDSARQLAWAIQSVADEMSRKRQLGDEAMQQIRMIGQGSGLDRSLPTGLYNEIYPTHVNQDLTARESFSIATFRAEIRGVLPLLPPSPAEE